MEKFNRYKALKEKLDIKYRSIDFNRVLALDIWYFANRTYKFSVRQLDHLIISLDFKDFKVCTDQKNLLTTYGLYNRKDHQELYYNVIDKLGEATVNNNLLHFKQKITVHPRVIMYFVKQVFSKLRKTEFSSVEKLIISAKFVHYANILKEIEKIDISKVKKYLALCGVLDVENLMTQYLQKRNIKTFSLHHGITLVFTKNISIDSLNYENVQSDILLCWGQYFVDNETEYGISKERLVVAGYPKKGTIEKVKGNNPFRKAIVLLARPFYQSANISLIDILIKQSHNYSFSLKLHPSCNFEFYKNQIKHANIEIIPTEKTVTDCLTKDNFDFAIVVNTTAYYETLMRGIPCLRFADGSFDLMHGYDDVFYDENNFLNRINEIKNKSVDDYQHDIDSILKYTMGIGIDNYEEILLCE